jgi:hypothetical protein
MNFDDKIFTIPIIIKSATLYGTQGVVSNVFGDNSDFKNVLEKSIKDNLNSKWGLWDKSKLHNREVVYQFDYSNLQ